MKNQLQISVPEGSIEALRSHFPLDSIDAVVALFQRVVRESEENAPNLALLSILLGFFESKMHLRQQQQPPPTKEAADPPETTADEPKATEGAKEEEELVFPSLTFECAKALYQEFVGLVSDQLQEISDAVEDKEKRTATRELIKTISDLLWKQLSRNYQKEKTHIQFLYSFLTGECLG